MQSTISRRKPSDRRTLVVALLLGAIAAALVVAFLSSVDREQVTVERPAAVKTRSIVVAKEEIAAGVTIEDDMLERKDIPEAAVIAGAAVNFDEVAGEVARYPVTKGEQLNAKRVVAKTDVQTLSYQIPEGLRGFTIPVEVNTSPAALLAPGDFVDVLAVGKLVNLAGPVPVSTATPVAPASEDEPKVAVTLLQNIQVLAVQREYVSNGVPYDSSVRGAPPKEGDVSYVTLALTPDQSQLVWLASQDGKLTLSLRAFGDDKTSPLSPVVEPVRINP